MQQKDTRYKTSEIICSFPHLYEVYSESGKYGLSIPIPKKNRKEIAEINKKIENAVIKKWGEKATSKLGTIIDSPFRDIDDNPKLLEMSPVIYKDVMYINAKNAHRPGVVEFNPEWQMGDPERNKTRAITDPQKVYAGCIIKAYLTFFGYDVKNNTGVGVQIDNVLFLRDGIRAGGTPTADEDFANEDFTEESLNYHAEETITDDPNQPEDMAGNGFVQQKPFQDQF